MTTLGARAEILTVPSLVARRRPRRTVAGLALALLAPTLIFLLVFTYWPLVVSAVGSFERWSRTGAAPRFVGTENYRELWRDALFRQVLRNTAAYVLVEGPLAVFLGLACALAVDGHRRLRLVARALVFHPVLLPTVAIAAIWLFLLNPVSGPVVDIMIRLLGWAPNFLGEPRAALLTVALVAVYKNCGLYMLFFLAGLQAIPRDLQDGARVEGASEWRVFRHVTWPLLGPVSLYVGITAALDALRNVDHIFVLTRGGPANATNVLLYETYLKAFEFWDTGRASALTVMMVVALLGLAVLAMPRLERGIHYEA
ncbi:MAG: ABC transporter permease [Candidatus Rokuibacteriota bacterium]|nr:MAG: ABC transporter permease [Candidatus Rokubacteria bacterium]